MSRISHDDEAAECVALVWHKMATIISAFTVLVGVGGFWWHVWAISEHRQALKCIAGSAVKELSPFD